MPEILDYYGKDEGTRVIMMQTESFKDPAAFLRVASEITPHKPILAIKAGRTSEGSRAVSSHTGTLVDQAAMARAMYQKAGVVEFRDTHQMIKALLDHAGDQSVLDRDVDEIDLVRDVEHRLERLEAADVPPLGVDGEDGPLEAVRPGARLGPDGRHPAGGRPGRLGGGAVAWGRWRLLRLSGSEDGRGRGEALEVGVGQEEGVKAYPIPLPPLAKQHRIVAKVDELGALCDRLEARLSTTQRDSRRLLEAVLRQALVPVA